MQPARESPWLASDGARYKRPGKGVEGVYNRHDCFEDRRWALEAWGQLLLKPERHETLPKKAAAAPPRQTTTGQAA